MAQCKAFGCANKKSDKDGKSFFKIPDAKKYPWERERAIKWLHNIGTGHDVDKFKFNGNQVVCQDHFEPHCFKKDLAAEWFDFVPGRKELLKNAVPTIFVHKRPAPDFGRHERLKKRKNKQMLRDILSEDQPLQSTSHLQILPVPETNRPYTVLRELLSSQSVSSPAVNPCLQVNSTNGYSPPGMLPRSCTKKRKRKRRHIREISSQKPNGVSTPGTTRKLQDAETQTDHVMIISSSAVPNTQSTGVQCPDTYSLPADNVLVEMDHCYSEEKPVSPSSPSLPTETQAETSLPLDPSLILPLSSPHLPVESQPGEIENPLPLDSSLILQIPLSSPHLPVELQPIEIEIPLQLETGNLISSPHEETSSSSSSTSSSTVSSSPPSSAPSSPLSTPQKLGCFDQQLLSSVPCSPTSTPQKSDKIDSSFHISDEDVSTEASEDEYDLQEDRDFSPVEERKFLVFESCLESLCRHVVCSECGAPVDDIQKAVVGSCVNLKLYCTGSHLVFSWDSQPKLGPRMPAGNLILAGAILFSGQTYTHIASMAKILNLVFISKTSYYKFQNTYLIPEIASTWKSHEEEVAASLKGGPLILCGDGRCDSPGFCAKYCTYTFMESVTKKVVKFDLVQVSQTGTSQSMEKHGYENCLDEVLDSGLQVAVCATDRHVSIRSLHKKKYAPKGIEHQFDVYHMSKSIQKKLVAKAKTKSCKALEPWIRSITNHLWWSALTCQGNPDNLVDRWRSIKHHIVNMHTWDDLTTYKACEHPALTPEQIDAKQWFKYNSPPYKALIEITEDKRLLKDIRQLSQFCHTGMLEVYHSMMLKYVPKRQEFDYKVMLARTQLAALDNNHSLDEMAIAATSECDQTASTSNSKKFRAVYSKITQQWVLKPTSNPKSGTFKLSMLEDVVARKVNEIYPDVVELPPGIGKNIAPVERPPLSVMYEKHRSRLHMNKH